MNFYQNIRGKNLKRHGLKLLLLTCIIIVPFKSHAGIADELMKKIRPLAVKVLGEEKASQYFGGGDKIQLPEIPEIVKDNKDAGSIGNADSFENKLTKEERQKYNYLYLREIFEVTRNSKPNDDEIARWMNVLGQGGTREGVYRALVLDGTYKGLENFENQSNEKSAEFAVNFLARFVRQGVKKEALEKVNFYALKRVVTEKALEVVDALSPNKDDLHDWYAVFSGEMASTYPNVWKNALRKETSMKKHKAWASAVPRQHLKSEVIIKIHKIFNYLANN